MPAMAATGESLSTLALPDAASTLAQEVAAGSFVPPVAGRGGRGAPPADALKSLPAFCRFAATLKPTGDSEIKIEVWLPSTGWNGKFQAVGNGGWTGSIAYPALMEALRRGYATSSTDTGHEGGTARFALGHPEKLVDFGYRSVHDMTVAAKTVIAAFYGNAPKFSYWNGCSAGGRQGLKEAQRFPTDFDGIIAGAPASDWTGRAAQSLRVSQALHKEEDSYIPPAKYPVIHQAAVAACDARDGLADGLIGDPATCSFDPTVLLCKAGDGPSCLTAPQVEAAKKIYSPAVNPRTGKEMFQSLVPGTELGWGVQALGPEPSQNIYDQFRYVVFKDPNWDWKSFDFDKDVVRGDQPENLIMNATNPDMKKFFSRGGKLLMYHGWSDPNVPTVNTIKYFNNVVQNLGGAEKASKNVRLFLAPGMGHCGGGEGPNVFDKIGALERWVEQGQAPDALLASKMSEGKVDRTRPLCPYPQVAKYKGTGSIDDAANFVCAVASAPTATK
jgi:feruloyl esterase